MNDANTDKRKFRIVTVIHNNARENLELVADISLCSWWVSRELD